MAAKPIADTIWRGSFMISRPEMRLNLVAHLSSKACAKVWLAAKEMEEVIYPEFLPKRDVWPKSFKSSKLIDDNIAIYFFSVKGRDDQVFENLLYNLRHYDIALKALVGDSELLIFTSAHLPEKHHRFEGKLYLWGVFSGRESPPQHSPDDCFIHNSRVTQASILNSANDGNDKSCKEFSNKKDPSPASKTARKGRPLDDAWQHATPVDGKKQRTVCNYCGFISSSGGITYLKTHLGGGDPTGSLKGCPNVPPEVKRVMKEWLLGTIRGGKAPQLHDIRTDFEVFGKAVMIHSYISQRTLLLNMMRRYTKQRNLVKPAKTRFATAFLTLHSFYTQKKNLRTLFMSTEWNESVYAKETLGKDVARHIISPYFWNDIVQALRVGGPLVNVLRMVDGEKKPPMGYIYEAMDRAKESIEKAFNYDDKKYMNVFKIIDARWTNQLHQPLHAAGHILNPGLYYKNNEMKTLTEEVWLGYHACVERMIVDKTLQDKIGDELGVYMKAEGLLGIESAIRARTLRSPVEWWMQYGHNVPNLQQFAIRVQSLTCSSSGCERNWSVYEHDPIVCAFSSCSSKLAAPASKKSVRRGRPLDAAWDHATPVDAKRQRAVCKYCGFISSSGGITHLKAHLSGGDPKGPSKGCPNVPPEVKRAMAESLNRTVKGVKSMQPEEIRTYMKAENDWSPPRSDDYSLNQHRIVKNAQYSHLASGGNSVNDMTMSKQSETAHVDSYMEVMSSHNACKSSFLSKPTTRVGFI